MENTPWKEYETGGRKYWVHNLSKETTWSMPKEISGQSALLFPECISRRLTAVPRCAQTLSLASGKTLTSPSSR